MSDERRRSRDRDRERADPSRSVDDLHPSVGKRTLTVPSRASVDKRTLTQDLPPPSRRDVFAGATDKLRQSLPRLRDAIAVNDFAVAAVMAWAIRQALEDAGRAADGDLRGELDVIAAEAAPLLTQAPQLSMEAYRERYHSYRSPRPTWDAEERAWLASRGVDTPRTADLPADLDDRGRATAATHGARAEESPLSAVARLGTHGSGSSLPHLDWIQKCFGRHDVTGVRAFQGGATAQAASALGAEAFAFGDAIGFASSPDLHTAAHEAAHVVQQRRDVQLKGGIDGGAGDPLERHADRVADAVVAGHSAEAILDEPASGGASQAIQRKPTKKPLALVQSPSPPAGTEVASAQVELAKLPPELSAAIGPVETTVSIALYVDGEHVVLGIRAGASYWIASANASDVIRAMIGPLGGEALAKLGAIRDVLAAWSSKTRLRSAGSTRVHVDLWGQAAAASWVVIDLAAAVASIAHGSAAGFQPVEAKLELGKATGVSVFAGNELAATQALPSKSLQGGWFDVPDPDGTIKSVVGGGGKASVQAAIFFDGETLSVAVRENEAATRGAIAHVNLAYLLDRLKALGQNALAFLQTLLDKLKAGAIKLFRVLDGLLTFDLPELGGGSWLSFDFKLQLPRLFRGGGGGHFDLSGLWPTGFHFELPGLSFGALPRVKLPWLALPKLGGFRVPWDRIKGLLGELPDLPRLPHLDLELHFIGDLRLGFAIDLSKVWPDFGGGDAWFSFELDLGAILDKLAGAGRFILDKLRKLKNWFLHWVHLGSDGVLRIYDDREADGPMLGFHLLRLLDGVQPTDLAPTEMRWSPGKQGGFALEAGEAAPAPPDPKAPARKSAPAKPSGLRVMSEKFPAQGDLATMLALAPGTPTEVELYWDHAHERVIAWAHAPSAVYAGDEAFRLSISYRGVADAVAKRLPAGKDKAPSFPAKYAEAKSISGMVVFAFGDAARDLSDKRPPSTGGYAGWKLSRLVAAHDLASLVPDVLDAHVEGVGAIALGKLDPPSPLIGGQRIEVPWKELRKDVLHVDDGSDKVWAGVHAADDIVALSLTKDPTGNEGVMAEVHLSFLLRQLERLGKLGEKVLNALAKALGAAADAAGSFADRAAKIAAKIGKALLHVVNGILQIKLPGSGGGGWFGWNLKAQLPRLGLDFDWSKLVPEFDLAFDLGGGNVFSMAWLPKFDVRGVRLPKFPFDVKRLRGLLDGIPGLDLSKLKGDFSFELGWYPSDMTLDLGIDLSALSLSFPDLFGGGGGHWLGFRVPIGKLLAKLEKLGSWFRDKLAKVPNPLDYIAMGTDGVLRIHDPGDKSVIGFDLYRLLDGIDASDLVPVEIKAEVDNKKGEALADLRYGQVTGDPAKRSEPHQVLVPRPTTTAIAHATPKAPEAVREYLGAAPNAVIDVSLYLTSDKDKSDAIVFAALPRSDHGVELTIHYSKLASAVDNVGPIQAPGSVPFVIDRPRSLAKGELVVTFGPQPKAGERPPPGMTSGYVGWKLENLIGARDLSALVPDELHVANNKGELTAGSAISLAGLARVVEFDVPVWAQKAVGATQGEVWAAHRGDLRVALVEKAAHAGGTARGVLLDLDKTFVGAIEHRLSELVQKAQLGIGHALKRAGRGAGQDPDGKSRIAMRASSLGLVVERGRDGEPDYMYATFGWEHVGRVANGEVTVENLMPVEFRVATKSMALEVTTEAVEHKGEHPPEKSNRIGSMHELIRGPLTAIGLKGSQWLAIIFKDSRLETVGPAGEDHRVLLVAEVYDVDVDSPDRTKVTVTGGMVMRASINLEAVLAQVMPKARKLFAKKPDPAARKPSRVSASIEVVDDLDGTAAVDPGIQLTVNADISTARTKRGLGITAGWTLDQILELLLRMGDMIDDDGASKKGSVLGLLAPTMLKGKFSSEKWSLEFGTTGHHSQYNCSAKAIPGMVELLSEFLDPATAKSCIFNLDIPSESEMVNNLKKALLDPGIDIPLAGANIEVPHAGGNRFYGFTFAVSPEILFSLASFIPEIGIVVKLAKLATKFLSDPGGVLEDAAYTPELMYHLVRNLPDIVDNMRKKSFKEIAVGLIFSSDASNKQMVMAARLYEKLKKDPKVWDKVQAMKDNDEYSDIAGVDADKLRWLAEQDPNALERMFAYDKVLKEEGINIGDENKDFKVPDHDLDADLIDAKVMLVQSGYESYAIEMDANEKAKQAGQPPPYDQKHLDQRAKQLHDTILKYTGAGAKPVTVRDPRKASPSAKPADIKPPELDLDKISGMPDPDDAQIKQAQQIYQQDAGGAALRVEADYMVKKYAALSTDQLAQLLTTTKTSVTTRNGPLELHMPESERDFVRSLFLLRIDPHAQVLPVGQATAPKISDDDLVKRWRAGGFKGKGVQSGQDAPTYKHSKQGHSGANQGGGEGDEVSDVNDTFGDEQQIVDVASGGGGGGGPGDGDPDQHMVQMDEAQMRALVVYDPKADTLSLDPKLKAGWLTQKAPNSQGVMMSVHDVRLDMRGTTGASADSQIVFRLTFDMWTVGDAKTPAKHDHFEGQLFVYDKKSKRFGQRHQDRSLNDVIAQQLVVEDGKVKLAGKGDVELSSIAFHIDSIAKSQLLDKATGTWSAALIVRITKATDDYLLLDDQSHAFRAKDEIGGRPKMILVTVMPPTR